MIKSHYEVYDFFPHFGVSGLLFVVNTDIGFCSLFLVVSRIATIVTYYDDGKIGWCYFVIVLGVSGLCFLFVLGALLG